MIQLLKPLRFFTLDHRLTDSQLLNNKLIHKTKAILSTRVLDLLTVNETKTTSISLAF